MSDPAAKNQQTLTPEDAAAVDAVLDRAAPSIPAPDVARQRRAAAWLKVLAAAAVPAAPADLADRTLARIADDRMKLPDPERHASPGVSDQEIDRQVRRRWSRQIANFAAMAIAASILLVVSIMGVGYAEQSHKRTLCAENLKGMSRALAAYAADFSNQLPSLATPANNNWLANASDGPAQNTSNLAPLLAGKYAMTMANFYCAAVLPDSPPTTSPSNLGPIGYSYTLLYAPVRPFWDGRAATIILADKNPLFAATPPAQKSPDINSQNHGGHGQYILSADASVKWVTSPNVGPSGDNIWSIARGKDRLTTYRGTELPTTPGDIFLCP